LIWTVTVLRRAGNVSYPSPPQPPAEFLIVGADVAARIEAARATQSHLLLGMSLWNAGLISDAHAEFAALAKENPQSDAARQLADSSAARLVR